MRVPFEPPPRDPRTDQHLLEIPRELFDETLYRGCELVDRYALDLAYDLAHRLELASRLETPAGATMDELLAAGGFAPRFAPALRWLLHRLAADGALEPHPETTDRWRAPCSLRRGETAELRALATELDPELVRTLDLFDAAAAAWPRVASGAATGEQELFGAGQIALWIAYFHNRNAPYALTNRMTAGVAANRLPRSGARILEVGAGAGSATEALLEELARRGRLADVAGYDATEPSPFFRRRAERELSGRFPGVPLRFGAYDIDRPAADQGRANGHDLVLGVNVLHVARSLARSLVELRSLLAPGGWLVAGECVRLFPGQPVAADLVFQLFRGFVEVETDEELRPTHGFLEPRHWRAALTAAGFEDVAVLPDLDRIRDLYPRFSAAVVVGRAPLAPPAAAAAR